MTEVKRMNRIIAVCGKICCGKSYYCDKLKQEYNAVVLSSDEVMNDLFSHNNDERHDEIADSIHRYLHKKAVEIVSAGCNVILDWGFWRKSDRLAVTEYYRAYNIDCEWHYIDITDDEWAININERNKRIKDGFSSDYYVDEGLFNKVNLLFEMPEKTEIDVWHKFKRE